MATVAVHKIFNSKPSFGASDFVGRFRSGWQDNGKVKALQEWRVTSDDPSVVEAIAAKYGGTISQWETKTGEIHQAFTEAEEVEIELLSLLSEFTLWGRGSTPIRVCDSKEQRNGGGPCVCPLDVKDHKEQSRAGTACSPSIRATFKLAGLEDLGVFRFNSGSWGLLEKCNALEDALAAAGGPSPASLRLKHVAFENATGKKVEYTLPILDLHPPLAGTKKAA